MNHFVATASFGIDAAATFIHGEQLYAGTTPVGSVLGGQYVTCLCERERGKPSYYEQLSIH